MLSGTRFTTYVPSAPVPSIRVSRREVNTSVLNGFPDSQRFRSRVFFARRPVGGFSWLPKKRVFLLIFDAWVRKSSAPSARYHQILGATGLALGEPVVPRRVWISLVKLQELLQTAYRKVVEWFLRPVFSFRIIEPLDEV